MSWRVCASRRREQASWLTRLGLGLLLLPLLSTIVAGQEGERKEPPGKEKRVEEGERRPEGEGEKGKERPKVRPKDDAELRELREQIEKHRHELRELEEHLRARLQKSGGEEDHPGPKGPPRPGNFQPPKDGPGFGGPPQMQRRLAELERKLEMILHEVREIRKGVGPRPPFGEKGPGEKRPPFQGGREGEDRKAPPERPKGERPEEKGREKGERPAGEERPEKGERRNNEGEERREAPPRPETREGGEGGRETPAPERRERKDG